MGEFIMELITYLLAITVLGLGVYGNAYIRDLKLKLKYSDTRAKTAESKLQLLRYSHETTTKAEAA